MQYLDKFYADNGSSPEGLSDQEAIHRINSEGYNELKSENKFSLLKLFTGQFKDLLIIILIFAGIVSLIVGDPSDSIVIFAIVFLNAAIGFIQEFKAEKSLEALKKMISPNCKVVRSGIEKEIEVKDVARGDIVIVEEGDRIPADGIIIEAVNARVNEAALTGESVPVSKVAVENPEKVTDANIVFTGTILASGRLKAIVSHTGMNTRFGKIAKITTSVELEKSPLQDELNSVGKFIGKFTFIICLIVFTIGIIESGFSTESIVSMFLFAIALAVAVVPEGLPATVTIALAMGVRRMAKENAIIRKLSSVETLGCTSVICTDKTGTLTKNEMTVTDIYTAGRKIEVTGIGYQKNGSFSEDIKKIPDMDNLIKISMLCNNAHFRADNVIGDPTEIALQVMGSKAGYSTEELTKEYKRIDELTFDSDRKLMTTVHKCQDGIYSYTKGAPKAVLSNCTHIQLNGKVSRLTESQKNNLLDKNREMGNEALRVLACAYRKLTSYSDKDRKSIETNMIFVGLTGMIDPPRPDIKKSIELCNKAGITVIMTTGDQRTTALAVAKQIGLVSSENGNVVTGSELTLMKDSELEEALKTVRVFARISPEGKMRIIQLLKKNDHIVAMTGDGVNDAPALKKANIGVAMGKTGTDIAKEASKMVILDDSFSTIVRSIRQGRSIYDNIKKFILYVFSGILAELIVVMVSLIPGVGQMIHAVQILWIDLGTEVLPALALGVDPPASRIMERKPRSRTERIMNREMLMGIARNALVIAIASIMLYLWQLNMGNADKAGTIVFVTIIIFQMVNVFNCRDRNKSIFQTGIFSNLYLISGVLISTLLTVLLVSIPFIAEKFHAVPLSGSDWIVIGLSALSIIAVNEVTKLFLPKSINA